jgi:hypothetical protein
MCEEVEVELHAFLNTTLGRYGLLPWRYGKEPPLGGRVGYTAYVRAERALKISLSFRESSSLNVGKQIPN